MKKLFLGLLLGGWCASVQAGGTGPFEASCTSESEEWQVEYYYPGAWPALFGWRTKSRVRTYHSGKKDVDIIDAERFDTNTGSPIGLDLENGMVFSFYGKFLAYVEGGEVVEKIKLECDYRPQ